MVHMADFRRIFRRTAFGGLLLVGLAAPTAVNAATGNTGRVSISVMPGPQHVEVSISAHDPIGLKSIKVYLNRVALENYPKRNLRIRPRDLADLKNLQGVREYSPRLNIPVRALEDGENIIVVHAKNMQGRRRTKQLTFRYRRPKGTFYVVSIGINKYRQSSVPALKYAENDARAVETYFREKVGVPKSNIFTLIGKQATERNIKRLLGVTLKRKAGRNDQIVIFYAGHGVPESEKSSDGSPDQVEKYLLPWDGETDALIASAIPMSLIGKFSSRYSSERVVFLLDTCFSGAAARPNLQTRTLDLAMAGRRSVRLDDGFLDRMAKARGKVILTASGINETSQELDSLRHGVFTYYLLEGMKGRADFDADGVVSVPEIHKFLSETVPPRTNQEQQPAYFVNSQVTGEIVLGRSPVATLRLYAPDPWSVAGDSGRLVLQVLTPGAHIYIQGEPRDGSFINSLLEPGRYRLRIEKDGYEPYVDEIRIRRRSLSHLKIPLKKIPRQKNAPKKFDRRPNLNWRAPPP